MGLSVIRLRAQRRYDAKPHRRAAQQRRFKARYQKHRQFIYDYKSIHPCVDCGETDPIVLDFDHRDMKRKSFSLLVSRSLATIMNEIAKCDVRCANCHRRRHYKNRGAFNGHRYRLRGHAVWPDHARHSVARGF